MPPLYRPACGPCHRLSARIILDEISQNDITVEVECYLIFAPGGHDKWIIDGDADDVFNPGGLELVCGFDVACQDKDHILSAPNESLMNANARMHTWQVRLGAAGGEGAGDAEHHELATSSEFGQIDLFVGCPLEEIDGGDGVSGLDGSHAGRVEESVGDGGGGDAAGEEARERLHCSLRWRRRARCS